METSSKPSGGMIRKNHRKAGLDLDSCAKCHLNQNSDFDKELAKFHEFTTTSQCMRTPLTTCYVMPPSRTMMTSSSSSSQPQKNLRRRHRNAVQANDNKQSSHNVNHTPHIQARLFLLQAISITQAGKPAEKLELAFRLYDIDRNGTIDQQEMTDIIKVGAVHVAADLRAIRCILQMLDFI
jgi:hypothetical protein